MDVQSVTHLAQLLGKLVGLGLSAWKAKDEPLGTAQIGLLKDAADVGEQLAPRDGTPRPPARHAALIATAFGEAWREHWALGERAKPGKLEVGWRDYFFATDTQRNLLADGSARLATALAEPLPPAPLRASEALAHVDAYSAEPLGTPAYRALWTAFAGPGPKDEPPLLALAKDERVIFERAFRRAYAEALAGPGGAEVRAWQLELVRDRAHLLRELLIADLASWGERHVFSNALHHDALPDMPLARIYVEPLATAELASGARKQRLGPKAVHKLLDALVPKHPLVLVTGDFGLGKSLTARMRAMQLARAYLAGNEPGPELELPIFVRCAEDLAPGEVDVERVIRRALQRHARTLGLELPLDDAALAPPAPGIRACFLFDGLDEVALGERQVSELLRALRERAGSKHRFIVFTRPAAVPVSAHGPEVPRVRLRELTNQTRDKQPGGQVGQWLDCWNALRPERAPLTTADLARNGLLELATTPILLFMIAFTWDPAQNGAVTHVELYERFFRQVARGKHELDQASHPQIAAASERLREAAVSKGLVPNSADPVEAMLWLLGRAAWEAARRHEKGEVLSGFHVERIVREELGVTESAEAVRALRMSLLLVLQAELDGSDGVRLLFGHKSFEEFLVARHWSQVLARIAKTDSHSWRELEKELCGARLFDVGERASDFLRRLLFAWDDGARQRVHAWAEWSFNEERLPDGVASFADDPRAHVREAALFLGSALGDGPGIAARTPLTLRSLIAWYWLHGDVPSLFAARLSSPGAKLDEAELTGARLEEANLRKASLVGAVLDRAQLFRADLAEANLDGAKAMAANLDEANLENALLREAFLSGSTLRRARLARATLAALKASGADFDRADLSHANLKNATLEKAILRGATLVMADLDRAKLAGADLTAADLSRANMHGADLKRATLANANLQDAVLRDAKLRDADLRKADLRRANLTGADLEGADLQGADLRDAILDGARRPDFTGSVR